MLACIQDAEEEDEEPYGINEFVIGLIKDTDQADGIQIINQQDDDPGENIATERSGEWEEGEV